MSKKASIVRLIVMALVAIGIIVLMIPEIFRSNSTAEIILSPLLLVGLGCMLAAVVWMYSKYIKYAHKLASGFMSCLVALSFAGLIIKLMLWVAIYGLPCYALGAVFMWIAGAISGSGFGSFIAGVLLVGVLPILIVTPMVISDICHIKGIFFRDWLREFFPKKAA